MFFFFKPLRDTEGGKLGEGMKWDPGTSHSPTLSLLFTSQAGWSLILSRTFQSIFRPNQGCVSNLNQKQQLNQVLSHLPTAGTKHHVQGNLQKKDLNLRLSSGGLEFMTVMVGSMAASRKADIALEQ